MNKLAFGSAIVIAAFAFTAPAQAETINCTAITALPYTITSQGVYCLTGHLSTGITSGNAIDIQTNNVVLDLNGFKLGGLAAGLGTFAIGIHADNRQNITIKNGTIRGFRTGIILTDSGASQGHVVEDIRADQNTFIGIDVSGSGNIIRNNQIVNTGGSTVSDSCSYGIEVLGSGARLINNDVIGTTVAPGDKCGATGILAWSAPGSIIDNNKVTDTHSPSGAPTGIIVGFSDGSAISANRICNRAINTQGYGYGIYFTQTNLVNARDNSISGVTNGIFFANAYGSYMGNMVTGATNAYTGGVSFGINAQF